VVAVGPEAYTSWEGYVEEDSGRAVIGLSYAQLCRDVRPGGRILLADGSITIKVGRCCCCCSFLPCCKVAKNITSEIAASLKQIHTLLCCCVVFQRACHLTI
jgi:hypothetical protein